MSKDIIEKNFDVSAPARLIIKNVRGSVKIQPGDAQTIKIKVTKHLNTGNPEDTEIILQQNEDGVVVAGAQFEIYGFSRINRQPCKVDFEIEVPASCSVRTKTVSAKSEISGLHGDFKFKSVSGSLRLEDLSGDLSATTVSGILVADKISGPAQLKTVSGGLKLTNSNCQSIEADTVSGSILAVTPIGDGPYRFKSVSGKVRLIVPKESACSIHASSLSGRFKTDLPVSNSSGGRRSWDVDIAGGGTPISMTSVSGSLFILSSLDAAPISPQVKRKTREERLAVLSKLEQGELSIEDTLKELSL
ncbi:DUF4097 domain-containing protein [Chloroflexota bacterium]